MSDPDESIHCATHGEAYTTYVCGHLAADPMQQWFCDVPSEEHPWPDAWCPQCDAQYLKHGEWNDHNSDCLQLKILCNHCYESKIAASVDAPTGDALESWRATVSDCHDALHTKQDALAAQYSLSNHKRWDYNQTDGSLVFSNDGVPAVVADIEFIGSISTKTNTWLWSWANFNHLAKVRTRIGAVRDFGEEKGFPRLTVPKWTADEVDGWEMSAIAVQVLSAHGVYRIPNSNGFLYMAITSIRNAP